MAMAAAEEGGGVAGIAAAAAAGDVSTRGGGAPVRACRDVAAVAAAAPHCCCPKVEAAGGGVGDNREEFHGNCGEVDAAHCAMMAKVVMVMAHTPLFRVTLKLLAGANSGRDSCNVCQSTLSHCNTLLSASHASPSFASASTFCCCCCCCEVWPCDSQHDVVQVACRHQTLTNVSKILILRH